MPQKTLIYEKSLNWNMLIEDGKLIITKGADELYLVEELSGEDCQKLYQAYKENKIHKFKNNSTVNENILQVISKLEKAGVIYKKDASYSESKPVGFAIRWIGASNKKIFHWLKKFVEKEEKLFIQNESDGANLMVIVRTSGKLSEVMRDYENIKIPHLFFDVAFDHTLSLGPFVFPNETACLGCFIGRITRNWGDANPPLVPNASSSGELIASLILEQVRTFRNIGSCPELIEKTLTLNLNNLTTKIDHVFCLPWCPICYPEKPQEGLGSFELPWTLRNNQLQ
ncbi:MAG: hypothetical protein N2558_00185 [Patescibacteria group bacterium]|nr:hypothetical protein [Patescibacteria group bacterium]